MDSWVLEATGLFKRKLRQYQKKHERETLAALNNLDTYVYTLSQGAKPAQIKAGFIHHEPHGVVAVDQKGAGKASRQTRLYVYAHELNYTVYLITIGDKNTQKRDIKDCEEFVKSLRKDCE